MDLVSRNANGKVPYEFDEQNAKGKIAESIFKMWMGTKPGVSVIDVSNDPNYQAQDVDFIVQTKRGATKVEVKGDAYTTGNIFIELLVSSFSSPESGEKRSTCKIGWLNATTADYVAYYFYGYKSFIMLDMYELRRWYSEYSAYERNNIERRALPVKAARNKGHKDSEYFGIGSPVPLQKMLQDETIAKTCKVYVSEDPFDNLKTFRVMSPTPENLSRFCYNENLGKEGFAKTQSQFGDRAVIEGRSNKAS